MLQRIDLQALAPRHHGGFLALPSARPRGTQYLESTFGESVTRTGGEISAPTIPLMVLLKTVQFQSDALV